MASNKELTLQHIPLFIVAYGMLFFGDKLLDELPRKGVLAILFPLIIVALCREVKNLSTNRPSPK